MLRQLQAGFQSYCFNIPIKKATVVTTSKENQLGFGLKPSWVLPEAQSRQKAQCCFTQTHCIWWPNRRIHQERPKGLAPQTNNPNGRGCRCSITAEESKPSRHTPAADRASMTTTGSNCAHMARSSCVAPSPRLGSTALQCLSSCPSS